MSTNKPDQKTKMLEAIRKMTWYFRKSIKHIWSCTKHNDHYQQISSTHHNDKQKHRIHCHKDKVNEITSDTHNPQITPTETDKTILDTDIDNSDNNMDSALDSKWLPREHNIVEVKLSDSKYSATFPARVNNNQTISLFDTGATISCMSTACFDKLDPKPH